MGSFLGFIVLSIGAVIMGSVTAFGKRALAKHRERLRKAGYRENNTPWRLRQDMYKRIFFAAYMVFGLLILLVMPAQNMRYAPPIVQLGRVLSAASFAMMLAFALWWVVKTVVEYVHRIGEKALKMRDTEWHPQMRPVQPAGEYGTAREASLEEAGLIDYWNLQGRQIKGFVPIVAEEKKDGEK